MCEGDNYSMKQDDTVRIETDLTEEEKEIVKSGREEYAQGGFVPLDNISL